MMEYDINADYLHGRLLEMGKAFHTFCTSNDIKYYMLGGTALGARRHEGFIPWDDDMDLGLPREDYNKLLSLKDHLPDFLELRFYKTESNSPMHFAKLIDNRTTLIEPRYTNYVEGLYIDIFPLDDAYGFDSKFGEKWRWKKIWLLQGLIIYHCMTVKPNSWMKRLIQSVSKVMNLRKLHAHLESLMTRYNDNNSDYLANFLGAWQIKEIVERSIFGKPKLYKFEDTYLYGPEDIDAYLTRLYGDYMKLPPAEKRVFKHEYVLLDFETPYRDYLKNHKF